MKRIQSLAHFFESSAKAQTTFAIIIILIFAGINVLSVLRNFSLTTDEDKHYLYGQNVLSGDSTRFDDSKMPVTALNAIPKALASYMKGDRLKYILNKLSVARMVTIIFSCLVAYLVFYWSRLLYGFVPALFSLTFYILDPNIIAHSQLVTTDVYVMGMMTFSFFALWRFANQRTLHNGLLCCFALGVSQITKYTAVLLYPLLLITLIIFDRTLWIEGFQMRRKLWDMAVRYVKYIGFAVLVSIIIINIGFLFNRTFTSFGDYGFRSDIFKYLQSNFPVLGNIPIPVPYPYLQGFDWMRSTERTGNYSGNVYLLGHISEVEGFPGYYFVASFFKVPIATQVIIISAFLVYFTRKDRRTFFSNNEIFLLVIVVFFAIYFNFFFNTQIGIRYYLPVFPLLYIFSGNLFAEWKIFSAISRILSVALIMFLAVSVFSYYPYHISYFNEFIGNRLYAYKYLADSNIDWGQAKNELRQYLQENPGALVNPNNVRPGYFVIRVNDLVGVTEDPKRFAWIRNNFEPVDAIAYAYLVYRITPAEIDMLCATTAYCEK